MRIYIYTYIKFIYIRLKKILRKYIWNFITFYNQIKISKSQYVSLILTFKNTNYIYRYKYLQIILFDLLESTKKL